MKKIQIYPDPSLELNPNKTLEIRKALMCIFEDTNISGIESREFIETDGDLDEWNLLIQEHNKQVEAGYNEGHLSIPDEKPIRLNETDLEKFFRVKDAMLMLWGMIGHAEANQLGGTFSEIKRKYPKLYKTCLVWGWG